MRTEFSQFEKHAKSSLVLIAAILLVGLISGIYDPQGACWIILTGACIWIGASISIKSVSTVGYLLFLPLAVALSNHWLPGFQNPLFYDHVQFAEDSAPFTMFLNFDKLSVGLFIFIFYLQSSEIKNLSIKDLKVVFKIFGLLLVLLLPLALATRHVRFDVKWPAGAWVWCLNNFFFVCFAEEALFRGFILNSLLKNKRFKTMHQWIPLLISSLIFGAAHFRGGLAAMGFACVAGVFYGLAFMKTQKIMAPMLVHFGLNSLHFILFSYPQLLLMEK